MRDKAQLKKFKENLVKKMPPSQKKAHRYIFKTAQIVFGFKVERERIFAPYIVDIYIKPLRVCIEIDGGVHNNRGGYDNNRDQYLFNKWKIKVYRFKNEEVGTDYFKSAIWSICFQGLSAHIDEIKIAAAKNNIAVPYLTENL